MWGFEVGLEIWRCTGNRRGHVAMYAKHTCGLKEALGPPCVQSA